MRKLHGSSGKKIAFSVNKNISRIKTKPTVSASKPISDDNIMHSWPFPKGTRLVSQYR